MVIWQRCRLYQSIRKELAIQFIQFWLVKIYFNSFFTLFFVRKAWKYIMLDRAETRTLLSVRLEKMHATAKGVAETLGSNVVARYDVTVILKVSKVHVYWISRWKHTNSLKEWNVSKLLMTFNEVNMNKKI